MSLQMVFPTINTGEVPEMKDIFKASTVIWKVKHFQDHRVYGVYLRIKEIIHGVNFAIVLHSCWISLSH